MLIQVNAESHSMITATHPDELLNLQAALINTGMSFDDVLDLIDPRGTRL